MIRGAIFDFDGTLFDSMFVWDRAGPDYLRSIGVRPKDDLVQRMSTMSLTQSSCYMKKAYSLPLTVDEIMNGINKTVENYYFFDVQPKKGVTGFLDRLRENGVKLCIATASETYMIEAALKRCGMEDYFSQILTCTGVGHGKDEPFIFREALRCMDTSKSDTYVFEDAFYAISTAKKDGFQTVGIFDQSEKLQNELKEASDYFMEDFSDPDSFLIFANRKRN